VKEICLHFPSITPENIIFHLDTKVVPIHSDKTISLQEFQNFLLWFGPFEGTTNTQIPTTTATTTTTTTATTTTATIVKIANCCSNMEEMCQQEWFHGNPKPVITEKGFFAVCFNSGSDVPIVESPFSVTFMDESKETPFVRVYFRPKRAGLEFRDLPVQSDDLSIIEFVKILQKQYPSNFKNPKVSDLSLAVKKGLLHPEATRDKIYTTSRTAVKLVMCANDDNKIN